MLLIYLLINSLDEQTTEEVKKNISKFFDSLLFVIFRATVPRANHVMMSVCDSYTSLWGSKRWYFLPPRDTMRFCRKQLTAPSFRLAVVVVAGSTFFLAIFPLLLELLAAKRWHTCGACVFWCVSIFVPAQMSRERP